MTSISNPLLPKEYVSMLPEPGPPFGFLEMIFRPRFFVTFKNLINMPLSSECYKKRLARKAFLLSKEFSRLEAACREASKNLVILFDELKYSDYGDGARFITTRQANNLLEPVGGTEPFLKKKVLKRYKMRGVWMYLLQDCLNLLPDESED